MLGLRVCERRTEARLNAPCVRVHLAQRWPCLEVLTWSFVVDGKQIAMIGSRMARVDRCRFAARISMAAATVPRGEDHMAQGRRRDCGRDRDDQRSRAASCQSAFVPVRGDLTLRLAIRFLGAAAGGVCAWTPENRSRCCSTVLRHCGCGQRTRNGREDSGTL